MTSTTAYGDMLLTEKDAAYRLGISPSTLRRRVSERVIPAPIKLGSLTRYRLSEILNFIENVGRAAA
jgi:excisionase family DNA binding protein